MLQHMFRFLYQYYFNAGSIDLFLKLYYLMATNNISFLFIIILIRTLKVLLSLITLPFSLL